MENQTTTEMSGKEDLTRQCAEEFLTKHPEYASFTVDQVLEHEKCRKQIDALAVKKAADLEAQAKKAAKKAEEESRRLLNEMAATLEAERPVSQEEIRVKLSPQAAAEAEFQQKLAAFGNPVQDAPQIPEAVFQQKQAHGAKLLACVYDSADEAVLFRGVIIRGLKQYGDILKQSDLSPEYREAVEHFRDKAQDLVSIVSQVITAWGLDPKGARVDNRPLYFRILQATENNDEVAFLVNIITKEMMEAKKVEYEEKNLRQAIRAEARTKIVEMLVAAGMTPEAAEKCSRNLVKKYYDECKGDAVAILERGAINKTMAAKSDEDKLVAGQYVQAAGLSEKDLADGIALAQKAATRYSNLHQLLGDCAMSPQAEAAHKAKQKGGGDGGKKNKKR